MSDSDKPNKPLISDDVVDAKLTIIERTYDSLKWPWLIIMSYSLTQAVKVCYDSCLSARDFPHFLELARIPFLIFFAAYLPTFLRYFIGDCRYIDLFAHEAKHAVRTAHPEALDVLERVFSRRRRIVDTLMLVSCGLLFVALGLSVANPKAFFYSYLLLMVLNIFWLYFVIMCNTQVHREVAKPHEGSDRKVLRKAKMIVTFNYDDAPRRWIVNNVIHLGVLSFVIWFANQHQNPWMFLLPLAICLSNSFFDVVLTHKFYFPEVPVLFHQLYPKGRRVDRLSRD